MLALGLLLVNTWLCLAMMFAFTRDAFPAAYAVAIFAAVGLTFAEVKGVERFAHWRTPGLDPTPRQEYWGIGIVAAVLFALALWTIQTRVGAPDQNQVPVEHVALPAS